MAVSGADESESFHEKLLAICRCKLVITHGIDNLSDATTGNFFFDERCTVVARTAQSKLVCFRNAQVYEDGVSIAPSSDEFFERNDLAMMTGVVDTPTHPTPAHTDQCDVYLCALRLL